jgi:hypothetical protein
MQLDLDTFTYITGIAGLLGLALQLKDVFPEHRETRKTIVMLVIGVFVGSLVSALRGVRVEFGATIAPSQVLVAVFVAVLAFAAVVAAFTKDPQRRGELFAFTGIGTAALFLLLVFVGMGSLEDNRAERERQQISLEELITLADLAVSRQNFERALLLLGEAKRRLPPRDERAKLLSDREGEVKNLQVQGKR